MAKQAEASPAQSWRSSRWLSAFALLTTLAVAAFSSPAAARITEQSTLLQTSEKIFAGFVDWLASVLFYEVLGFPFVVLWLIIAGVFFTLRMSFVNVRLFGHALQVVRGKYSHKDEPGEVTHFQALAAAVSATVGLGNIAGVAVAVMAGGPGAVVWMMLAGLLGMSTKFTEVTLGLKYRKFDKRGRVSGGAFHYLEQGLKEKNLPKLGKILAVIFAFCCLGGSMGGGNMFQANQTVQMMTSTFPIFSDLDNGVALVMAVAVGTVLIGGIRRIARVAEAIVPFMAVVYMAAVFFVLGSNIEHLDAAIGTMFSQAFSFEAAGGGVLGAIIQGFRRAAFSNEAGMGSAPIAHAAARTTEPVREGVVALLEPFIDTVCICFLTGLAITVSGVYVTAPEGTDGALLTSMAFATVIDWFPVVLSVCIALFAYSTMITWSYYGENAWKYLFGDRYVSIYHIIFCTGTFFGGVINFGIVLDFSDLLILAMSLPNIVGLYFLCGIVRKELDSYVARLKAGEFTPVSEMTEEEEDALQPARVEAD